MQSQLQGTGGWGILVLKKGASQQRVWFRPLQMLKETSTRGTWEPRLPAAPVSSSPCLESLFFFFFCFVSLIFKTSFFCLLLLLPSFFSPLV